MKKECICNEVSANVLYGEARTFKCPKCGEVTVDKRVALAPYIYPSQPYTAPTIQPQSTPPQSPWTNPWTRPTITYTSQIGQNQ